MDDRLLTTKQIQELLHLDRVTIYKLVKDGELPARRVGGQWRFSENGIQDWLQKHDEPHGRKSASRLDPQPASQPLSLTDLVPMETLQDIQNQFAQLLGVASFTIDRDGIPFAACSHCSRFCQLVHSTDEGFDACHETWREIASSAQEGAHIYRCHAGIQYASAPITVNGERLGMVTAGQFLTTESDRRTFGERALDTGRRIGVDGQALAAAGQSLEIVDADRALQITGILATIANTLSAIGYQGYLLRQKLAQIAALSASIPAADAGPGPQQAAPR